MTPTNTAPQYFQFQRRAGESMPRFMERATARWAGLPVFVTTPAGTLCECCAPFTGHEFDTTEASLQAGPAGCYNCGAGQ